MRLCFGLCGIERCGKQVWSLAVLLKRALLLSCTFARCSGALMHARLHSLRTRVRVTLFRHWLVLGSCGAVCRAGVNVISHVMVRFCSTRLVLARASARRAVVVVCACRVAGLPD